MRRGGDARLSAGRCLAAVSPAKDTGAGQVLFVGTGLFHPIGIALATKTRVIALDPLTGIAQEVSADTLLRRRFAVIEKAREAKDFGIILSTKSGQHRLDLARHLAALSPHATVVTMKEVCPDELVKPRVRLLCEHRLPPACV